MEDKTLFLEFFGTETPILKVIDFLMDNEAFDHSKTDITKGAGISRATLFNIWGILKGNHIVTKTREIGRAEMYKLNTSNPIIKKLMDLDDAISNYYAEQSLMSKRIMPIKVQQI
ncbi:MAG: hypothetical protein BME93_03570 [Methanosarcinales archaeon Met12]|nr:MAG: hypothetical protein BME93_03570 [Methanosarcinales archaeon Met12]